MEPWRKMEKLQNTGERALCHHGLRLTLLMLLPPLDKQQCSYLLDTQASFRVRPYVMCSHQLHTMPVQCVQCVQACHGRGGLW